ncbi:MAG: hypothetical protein IPF41_13620 [Flavobacteriales bacterium]|nr:hypothetical protein [Flavobacteriales bacterium]
MRSLFFIPLLLLGAPAFAQPDFDRNYCGFAPNDSIDITNDGIPDLLGRVSAAARTMSRAARARACCT